SSTGRYDGGDGVTEYRRQSGRRGRDADHRRAIVVVQLDGGVRNRRGVRAGGGGAVAEGAMIQPTVAPVRPFLDWPVVTDPSRWDAELALIGIPRSEAYPKDQQPNDQSRAPDAIRSHCNRFCYSPGNWDFDTGIDPASALPPKRLDLGNVPWSTTYDEYAASISERLRHLWRQR